MNKLLLNFISIKYRQGLLKGRVISGIVWLKNEISFTIASIKNAKT